MKMTFKRQSVSSLSLIALVGAVSSAPIYAQTQPNAGTLIREIQSEQVAPGETSPEGLTLPKAEAKQMPANSGAKILVKTFQVTGAEQFRAATLEALLADLQGELLNLAGLEQAAARITAYYQEQGYFLARGYLPQQDIKNGAVTIAVLEGTLADVQINNTSAVRDFVVERPFKNMPMGDALQAIALETPLLHLSDIPGINVTTTLIPGEEIGSSALKVDVDKGPRVSGTIELDNYGNTYTGEYRLGGSLQVNNPLGLGDYLRFRALGSDEDQVFYRAEYAAPVGPWATQVGVAYSDMEYTLGDDFADLNATGNAQISTVFIKQNLVRSRKTNVNIQLQYDAKDLEDQIGAFGSRSEKESTLATLTLSGDVRDSFGGWGITQFGLAYTSGDLTINSYLDQVIDSVSAETAGSFNRWTPSVMRLQNIGGKWTLHAQMHGQVASKNLDSSEKLSLGGTYGVRAYGQGAATGDEGWLANVEARYSFTNQLQVFALVDHGEVDVNKNPWEAGNNERSLSGAGLGVRWQSRSLKINATVAAPINKDDTVTGDQDTQVWAQAVWSF